MYIPIWVIVLTVTVLYLVYRSKQKQQEFFPVHINIMPKWSELLKDYKVVSDNSWDRGIPEGTKYHVLRDGINFTILSANLIYDNDRNRFKTHVDFRRQIDELSKDDSPMELVGLYVKAGAEGYELGLRTPESHKKAFKERQEYRSFPGDDSDLVQVANIPYAAFVFDINKKEQAKRIFTDLPKYGWKIDKGDPELSLVFPEIILEHKYFTVFYEYI